MRLPQVGLGLLLLIELLALIVSFHTQPLDGIPAVRRRRISLAGGLDCVSGHCARVHCAHESLRGYAGERIFVVRREGYVYLVPFVEDEHTVFLKTIIPSRKATKEHLGEGSGDDD